MLRFGTKLTLYNLFSKLILAFLFIIILPFAIEKINIMQTDRELVEEREKVLKLISTVGIEPFEVRDDEDAFSSFNILKEQYISIEKTGKPEKYNYIEITQRQIDNETIDFRVLNYSFVVNGETYLLEIGKSLPKILYHQKNITEIMLAFLALIILLTLFSDLLYTNWILRPLRIITNKLRNTSTPALFDRTPVMTSTYDFAQLDNTLRELMGKLDVLFSMEKDITVNISHELLTPVSILRSKFENLLLNNELDNLTKEKIEESLRTLYRLKTLVNSLLLVSRIESQQYLKEDSFEMTSLLGEITEELEPIASDKGVTLKEELKANSFIKGMNRSLIFSMIYNVVNNAIQNTGDSGTVGLHSQLRLNRYELFVKDTGRGMTNEQLQNIFQRFRKKIDPDKESNGIGLAITKTIADFHGIEVSVESEPGKGTQFSFLFPESS